MSKKVEILHKKNIKNQRRNTIALIYTMDKQGNLQNKNIAGDKSPTLSKLRIQRIKSPEVHKLPQIHRINATGDNSWNYGPFKNRQNTPEPNEFFGNNEFSSSKTNFAESPSVIIPRKKKPIDPYEWRTHTYQMDSIKPFRIIHNQESSSSSDSD